jgi:hypothetical protein
MACAALKTNSKKNAMCLISQRSGRLSTTSKAKGIQMKKESI